MEQRFLDNRHSPAGSSSSSSRGVTRPASRMSSAVQGSSGRHLLLLLSTGALFVLGLFLFSVGVAFLANYHLDRLSFATDLFSIAPAVIIVSGALTILVSCYGLILWLRRNHEMSRRLRAFACVLVLAVGLSLVASVASFLLREVIASHFSAVDVRAQIIRYDSHDFFRERWDVLQTKYACCGGHEPGYRDYANQEGVVEAVPDSCCKDVKPGCGTTPFETTPAIPAVANVIHTEGCMAAIRRVLLSDVLPLLLVCALVSLVVALIELLLVLASCCFADHVKKIKDLKRSSLSIDQHSGGVANPTVWSMPKVGGAYPEMMTQSVPGIRSSGTLERSTSAMSGRIAVPLLQSSPSLKRPSSAGVYMTSPELTERRQDYGLDSLPTVEPLYGNIETASAVSQASYVSEAIHKTQPQERPPTKPRSFFMKLLGRGDPVLNDEGNERRKEAFIEDAMDREKTLMSVLKNVRGQDDADTGKTKKQSSAFNIFKLRSKSKEDILAKSNEKLTSGRAKSCDNLNDRARGLLLLSKSSSRLANLFGRGTNREEKLVRDDESMSQSSDKRDPYAAIEKDKVVEEQEVVTEKITKLTKSNSIYIEASEVRKLKAIDENEREHDVRARGAAAMEEEARRLEDKLEGGEFHTEVKVEVIQTTVEEGERDEDKPRAKQTIKAAIKSVEEEIEVEEVAATARARSASPGKKVREGSRSPEKAKQKVTIVEDKERLQSYRKLRTPSWLQKPSRMLPLPEKHRSETDLRQEEVGVNDDEAPMALPRSESTTRLPYKKPTTIGSTDDILAAKDDDEEEEEAAAKKRQRLKKFFDSATSGPKSLPQSMTTAHQEMKAQLAAMQQQQHHNSMRRQRHLSGGGAKKEVNTQTTTTVMRETDLDAVVAQEPLKSALKRSGTFVREHRDAVGGEGGAVPKQTEVVKGGGESASQDGETAARDPTAHEDGTKDQVGSEEQIPKAKVSTTNSEYGQRVASAVGKWEEEERVRIAGFGVEKLEGSRKESVSQSQGRSRSTSDVHASGERVRRKSGDDRKDSRNLDLRKEHDEMRSRNQELRFAQEQTSPLPDYEEDVERDRRRRSSSRTRHITEIEVQPVTTTGEQYQGNAGHYGTLKITTIEHSEPRNLPRESRKSSRRAEEVPDHSFVNYRRSPQPVESAPSAPYGYRTKSADGRADKKWKMDKVSKPRGSGPTGSATSQEDSDEPVIFRETHHRVAVEASGGGDGYRHRHHSGHAHQRSERYHQQHPQNPARSLSPSSDLNSNPENQSSQPSSAELQKLYTPQFFLNRKDGSIVAAFVDNEPKRAAAAPSGAGDLVHLPFGRPRQVQSGEDYVSLDPTAIRSRSEPRRKKSDPGYVSSSLRSQSSEHGGGVGGVMARVLPRKKKTTVADPQDAWGILKDMRGQDDRQMYRTSTSKPMSRAEYERHYDPRYHRVDNLPETKRSGNSSGRRSQQHDVDSGGHGHGRGRHPSHHYHQPTNSAQYNYFR